MLDIHARENPFFPSDGEEDIIITSNEENIIPKLKRATISLPSDARIIESVTVKYKNLDGSQESKSIELEHSLDWHLPIFISQSYDLKAQKSKKRAEKEKYKEIAKIKYASFLSSNSTLKVITKDKLLRNFRLANPHRVVLDFKRDTNMKSYTQTNSGLFHKIRVGNHSGYYRVVIELDGQYRSNLEKKPNGYIIKLY